jgi:hypothetical protein
MSAPPGKILNPATGKYVSLTGKIGKALMEPSEIYHVIKYNSVNPEIGSTTMKSLKDLATYITKEYAILVKEIARGENKTDEQIKRQYPIENVITQTNLKKVLKQFRKICHDYKYNGHASDNHFIMGYVIKGGVVLN